MADEVITFQFQFTGQDQFTSAMNQMASAAEQMVAKVNQAVGQIKQPQFKGGAEAAEAVGRHAQKIKEHADKAGESISRLTEKAGGFAVALGAGFGEGGKILGEFVEKSLGVIGVLAAGFASLGSSGYRVGRGLGEIGSGVKQLESDVKSSVAQFAELKVAADGAKGAISGAVSSTAVGAAAGSAAGPYGAVAGGAAGLLKGVVESTVALAGALATVGVFGIERGEKLRTMQSAVPGLDIEGFRNLQAVAEKTGSSLENFMGTVSRISEGIHDLSLTSRVGALQLQEMGDRVKLVHDRLNLGAQERAIQEHKAADQIADSQHSIQQAHQGTLDAQQHYDEAVEEYQRHGKPRTRMEQQDYEEKQRQRNMEAAERGLKESKRGEEEAIHRQSDMIDQQKVQAQMREQQTHMEQLLIERMERRDALEKSSLERTTDPTKRLLIDYNKYVGGVTDLTENMKKVSKQSDELEDKDPFEKWHKSIEMLQQIRGRAPTSEFERLSNLLGGGALGGADLRRMLDEYVKLGGQPQELRKIVEDKGILSGPQLDTLAESKERFTRTVTDIANSLGGISSKYNTAINALIDSTNLAAEALMALAKTGGKSSEDILKEKGKAAAAEPKTPEQEIQEDIDKKIVERTRRQYRGLSTLLGPDDDSQTDDGKNKKSDLEKTKETFKKTLEQTAAEGVQSETTGKQVAKEGDAHATAAPKVEKLGQAAEKAQTALEKIFEQSHKGADSFTSHSGITLPDVAKMLDAAGINDYVVGYDRNGREILASGHKRVRDWGGPGSNIRRNPFVDGGPIDLPPNIRRNPYVDAQGRPIEHPQSREPGWNVRRNPYVDDAGNPIVPPRSGGAGGGGTGGGGGMGDKCCEGFEKHTDAVKKQTEATEKQTEATSKHIQVIEKPPDAIRGQGALMPLPRIHLPDTESINTGFETLGNAAEKLASAFERLSQSAGSSAETAQHGGLISGPGTGTSDSIPIRASAGEYVVRASAVSHLGKSFMDRINAAGYQSGGIVMPGFSLGGVVDAFSLHMPRFAAGGSVAGPAASAPLHPVTLNLPGGQSISGFHATPDAVAALNRHAVIYQASSTGRRPSWDR